jgi:hypothetical protein
MLAMEAPEVEWAIVAAVGYGCYLWEVVVSAADLGDLNSKDEGRSGPPLSPPPAVVVIAGSRVEPHSVVVKNA